MIIYKITNKINGKVYIGQTTQTLNKRMYGHLADSKRNRQIKKRNKISAAINLHGFDNFIFETIASANTQDELNYLEIKYIENHNACSDAFGYNLLSGGKQNGKHSKETKDKISISGKAAAKKAKENNGHWNKGRMVSKEQKAIVSQKLKGKPCPSRGRKYSSEEKIAISERMKKIRATTSWSTKKQQ